MSVVALALHALLMATMALALDGLLRQAAALWRHAPLPPLAQPWRDLVRLWRKPAVVPAGATWVFRAMPSLALGAAATAALLVPSFTLGMITGAAADIVVVGLLLATVPAALALAAFDSGSQAAAHTASRILSAQHAATPILLLAALAAVLLSGGSSLDAVVSRDGGLSLRGSGLLAGLALASLVVPGPAPPALHSGRDLALVTLAAQLVRVTTLSLAAIIGLPFGLALPGSGLAAWALGAACWVLKLATLGVLVTALGSHKSIRSAAALLALIAVVLLAVQAAP